MANLYSETKNDVTIVIIVVSFVVVIVDVMYVRNLTELHIGAPVVHEDHGVGRYLGLQTLYDRYFIQSAEGVPEKETSTTAPGGVSDP